MAISTIRLIATVLALATITIILATARILSILPPNRPKPPTRKRGSPVHLMIVLGSGGHTAEMLAILHDLDPTAYTHRTYVVSSGDTFSAEHARKFERRLEERLGLSNTTPSPGINTEDSKLRSMAPKARDPEKESKGGVGTFDIVTVPRARRVHQSFLTTPFSALQCLWSCLMVLQSAGSRPEFHAATYPDLILTNGPGTGVIVVLASVLLRFFGISQANQGGKMRSIYVESWARVKRLSLSGKLLLRIVDRFLVQWEGLEKTTPRAEYAGVLIS